MGISWLEDAGPTVWGCVVEACFGFPPWDVLGCLGLGTSARIWTWVMLQFRNEYTALFQKMLTIENFLHDFPSPDYHCRHLCTSHLGLGSGNPTRSPSLPPSPSSLERILPEHLQGYCANAGYDCVYLCSWSCSARLYVPSLDHVARAQQSWLPLVCHIICAACDALVKAGRH